MPANQKCKHLWSTHFSNMTLHFQRKPSMCHYYWLMSLPERPLISSCVSPEGYMSYTEQNYNTLHHHIHSHSSLTTTSQSSFLYVFWNNPNFNQSIFHNSMNLIHKYWTIIKKLTINNSVILLLINYNWIV